MDNQEIELKENFLLTNKNQVDHLLILEENTPLQRLTTTIYLEDKLYTIGRDRDNSITLLSQQVSRHHAYIRRQENERGIYYQIIDGSLEGNRSANGLFVNGKKILQADLKHGDFIQIGTEINLIYYIDFDGKLNRKKVDILDRTTISNNTFPDEEETFAFIARPQLDYRPDELFKFASILNLCPNPIIEIGRKGNITYFNPITRIHFPDLVTERFNHPLLKKLFPKPESLQTNLYQRIIKIEDKYFKEYVHYLQDSDLVRLYIFDVTAIRQAEKFLYKNTYYDFLTDLPNRKLFIKNLSKILANAQRHKRIFAILFLDLNSFKKISKQLGTEGGDRLLIEFTNRIKSVFRKDDTIARWEGVKFALLVTDIVRIGEISNVAERILELMKKPFAIADGEVYLTVNIGIAVYPNDGRDEDSLLKSADTALDLSKKYGNNMYAFYSPKIKFENEQVVKINKQLERALEHQELAIYYQPIVDNYTQKIVALEALIRWHHSQKGLVLPQEFLPAAEITGMIEDITFWMLGTICHQKSGVISSNFAQIPVSLNISTRLFQNANACERIIDIIKNHPKSSQFLFIEITENTFLESESIRDSLKRLLNLGVKICLDDFGSGSSSLNILKKFPFHSLKISQNLVRELKDNPQDRGIFNAIISMARAFQMRVIAEGVETEAQWALLKELGCDFAQGYLFSEPIPLDQIYQFFNL